MVASHRFVHCEHYQPESLVVRVEATSRQRPVLVDQSGDAAALLYLCEYSVKT